MATLERAIEIAVEAHAGQLDKADEPYILHPIRVMLRMKAREEQIVAVLHDVIEDSTWTTEDLAEEGFSREIVEAVDLLTKRPGESRMQAAIRASRNIIAKAVKLADNAENMDMTRIANPTEEDYARLAEYEKVRAMLCRVFKPGPDWTPWTMDGAPFEVRKFMVSPDGFDALELRPTGWEPFMSMVVKREGEPVPREIAAQWSAPG